MPNKVLFCNPLVYPILYDNGIARLELHVGKGILKTSISVFSRASYVRNRRRSRYSLLSIRDGVVKSPNTALCPCLYMALLRAPSHSFTRRFTLRVFVSGNSPIIQYKYIVLLSSEYCYSLFRGFNRAWRGWVVYATTYARQIDDIYDNTIDGSLSLCRPLPAVAPKFTVSGFNVVFTLWSLTTLAKGGLDWSTLQIGKVASTRSSTFSCGPTCT